MKTNNNIEENLKHYLNNLYTQQEASKILDSIEKGENIELLEKDMNKFWIKLAPLMGSHDSIKEDYRKQASSMLRAKNRKYISFPRKYLNRVVSIAASIILICFLGIGSYKYFMHNRSHDIVFTSISTTYGETKTISLPDGTQVILNSCSNISFPDKFINSERLVNLEGEAYFQVSRDENQPFIITTENFKVRVLGTAFNIQAYREDEIQSVNVENGKVQVDMPDAMSRLSMNEQIIINTLLNKYTKEEVHNDDVAPWRTGDFYFNNEPIKDVVNQLGRIYDYSFVFQEGQVFDYLISGEHDKGTLKEILESIHLATGIKYRFENNKKEIILYK